MTNAIWKQHTQASFSMTPNCTREVYKCKLMTPLGKREITPFVHKGGSKNCRKNY